MSLQNMVRPQAGQGRAAASAFSPRDPPSHPTFPDWFDKEEM